MKTSTSTTFVPLEEAWGDLVVDVPKSPGHNGVSNKDSRRSGLKDYNADAGIKDVGINLGLNWVFTQNWSARGIVSYTQLLGDASDDSPVVDEGDEGQLFTTVMAVYSF